VAPAPCRGLPPTLVRRADNGMDGLRLAWCGERASPILDSGLDNVTARGCRPMARPCAPKSPCTSVDRRVPTNGLPRGEDRTDQSVGAHLNGSLHRTSNRDFLVSRCASLARRFRRPTSRLLNGAVRNTSSESADADHDGAPAWVVFLHGQPGAASDWEPVTAELPPQLRVLTVDRPGYRANPLAPRDLAGNAHWLVSVLDDAGIDSAILVGHSYGGGVALATAALAPDRVRGLALISSVGPDCLDGWDALLAAPVTGPVCALTAWWLTPWFARRRLARIQRIRDRPVAPDEHVSWEIWGNARHEHGAMWRTFLTEQRALVNGIDELDTYVDRVTAPTVLIADPADKMIPITTAHALHQRLRESRLVLATGGGHHLPRRKPAMIAREITNLAASL
jgi:pimeloyl-ACP methyl ester carboxylesterase